jgi:hypothetical protein
MHTYYKPALEIREIGRLLKGRTFAELTDELGDGEVLFELLERPDHVSYAILISNQETFDEFVKLSVAHPYARDGYFAVAWSDAEEGTDELHENWFKP